ncbi:MAG: hypothetical protein JWQ72_147 [Polaromonas sp.]|nr:hypothetical protein [Polaromonas sp.]
MGVIHSFQSATSLRPSAAQAPAWVRYSDDLEVREEGEDQLFEDIILAMRREGRALRERSGHTVRASHAKSHGLAKGELRVLEGLPHELRQGLFAEVRSYPVIVRLAQVPGELVDDRKVSTGRGMSLKVVGVAGAMLAGHEGKATQDFLLDTGTVFSAAGPREFLAAIRAQEQAACRPEGLRRVISLFSRAASAALQRPGGGSANHDFFGHPVLHPLADTYYSQTPLRYGDFIAKLRVRPLMPALQGPTGQQLDLGGDSHGLRTAVTRFMRERGTEFEVAVQLCTDLRSMPIENARADWSQQASPYRAVARLVLPPQDAYSPAREAYVEETLSFSPAHGLQAHRPLGGINRARLKAYGIMAGLRRIHNRVPINEPRSLDELPD